MIALTIGCCVTVLFTSLTLFSRKFDAATLDKLHVAMNTVEYDIKEFMIKAQITASALGDNRDLSEAIINNDRDGIYNAASTLRTMAQLDFCTIVDEEGLVLVRVHDPGNNAGGSLAELPHVIAALEGRFETYMVPGVSIPLGVMAGAPIYSSDGMIVGAISLGFRLDSQDFAQRLKDHSGCDVTVFVYDERVSSTVVDKDGTTLMGTKAPEHVSEKLLAGETYIGNIKIFDRSVLVYYAPLFGADHTVVGIISVGHFTADDTREILLFLLTVILITLVILAVCLFIARFVSVAIEQRLKNMQEDLRFALESAETANKAKSSFLATMSHEIRTPLNAIIGMTAIGRLTDDTEKRVDAFEKIDGASRHLLGIINDVLDFSKIESGKFELSPASFEFEKMLQKVVNIISHRIDERRQNFYVSIGEAIPNALIGDDQRLSQVITNLLSNAAKFTPEGGTIRLNSQLISEEGDMCRIQISVEDTGIGITDEQKERLFLSFEQAEAGTARKYGGTGLGLPISKHIVELMDGDIWVESELGKGSKFIFTVVLKRGFEEKRRFSNGVNCENIRIFAVDDEYEIREFFTAVSDKLGIACTVAASGEEALAKLEKDNCNNIYFIDWRLPDMDGGELIRRINEKATSDPIVIIFSSSDWNEIEDEARVAGAGKFLPKPLFPSTIYDVVNEYVGDNCEIRQRHNPFNRSFDTVDFSGCAILLVDDVEINREIVMSLLEPTHLSIECAGNGTQAVDKFTAEPGKYDLIFMDIQMPEMDGYEATRRIRASGVTGAQSVPIIAMTADVFKEDVEKCMAAGMNGHIGKPINIDEISTQLKQYLLKKPE